MAIARGAGTEIIRSAHFHDIDGSAAHKIIFGVQHHVYTVLSVIVHCVSLQAVANIIDLNILGYDTKAGTTSIAMKIFRQHISAGSTFVWNDKFSFNGHEPTDFTGPLDSIAKQDAIADQGEASKPQYLTLGSSHASDVFQAHVTYIDQNNA